MARKKRVKKSRKLNVKLSGSKSKINVVFTNLLFFTALCVLAWFLFKINLLAIIFGFVAVAFFITLLVLIMMRIIKKK